MELYQLIYLSVANRELAPAELSALLDRVRQNNAQRDITGLLVYHRGEFMQLLEGAKDDIFALYKKVAQDARHSQVNLMWSGPIERRAFAEWQMAFFGPDEIALDKMPGHSRFLEKEFSAQELQGSPSIGKDFLFSLRDNFLREAA